MYAPGMGSCYDQSSGELLEVECAVSDSQLEADYRALLASGQGRSDVGAPAYSMGPIAGRPGQGFGPWVEKNKNAVYIGAAVLVAMAMFKKK